MDSLEKATASSMELTEFCPDATAVHAQGLCMGCSRTPCWSSSRRLRCRRLLRCAPEHAGRRERDHWRTLGAEAVHGSSFFCADFLPIHLHVRNSHCNGVVYGATLTDLRGLRQMDWQVATVKPIDVNHLQQLGNLQP